MKKITTLAAAAVFALTLTACDLEETGKEYENSSIVDRTDAKPKGDKKKSEPVEAVEAVEEPEPVEPKYTRAQENAIDMAQGYLEYTAFSRSGLIEQLVFEGHSKKEATFAVNQIRVNWNRQAAIMAEGYLDYTSFSRSGLIEQLEFEGFTNEQAVHGANQAGM